MQELLTAVAKVRTRLILARALDYLGWTLLVGSAIFLLLSILRSITADETFVHKSVLIGVAAASILTAPILAWVLRPDTLTAAVELDRRLNLQERVSTALAAGAGGEFAQAVAADAVARIAGISPSRQFPLTVTPRNALFLGPLLAGLGVLWLVEPTNLFARPPELEPEPEEQVVRRVQEIGRKAQEKIDRLENKVTDPADKSELKQALEQLRNSRSSEETHKALAEMVRIGRKALERPDMQHAKARQENLQSRVFQPARTEAGARVQESLQKGDYQEAKAAARELQRELDRLIKEGREKNKDKIDQFKDDLKKLADDLRAAGRDRNLERSLEKAGVSHEEAERMLDRLNKPETPQQQRESLEKEIRERLAQAGLDQQKIERAIQQAREKANENRDLSRLADKLEQAARQLQQGEAGNIDPQEIEKALNEAGDQLDELEKLADSLRDLQSGLSELNRLREELAEQDRQAGRQPGRRPEGDECDGQGECAHADAEGKGKSGRCPICGKRRAGAGEPGEGGSADESRQAWGARPERKETEFKLTPDKLKGTVLKDKIIGRQLVDGANIAGKDEISYTGQIRQGRRAAAAMMKNDVIPGAYHDTVKRYYELNREGKAAGEKE